MSERRLLRAAEAGRARAGRLPDAEASALRACNRAKATGTQAELVAKLKERGQLAP